MTTIFEKINLLTTQTSIKIKTRPEQNKNQWYKHLFDKY